MRFAVAIGVCVALVLAAWLSRIGHLGPATLYQDDAWVALGWRAHRWIDLQRTGLSSLGFTILIRGWLNAVGFTNQNARWLPFVIGVTVAPVFFLAARCMRLRFAAAVTGAAMLVASPTLSSYSVRVKQYTLEVLLATVLVGLGWAVVQRPSVRRWLVLGGCSIACSFISFPLAGVGVGALAAGTLASWSSLGLRRTARSCAVLVSAATAVVTGALYLIVVKPTLASPSLKEFWRPNYPTYHFPNRQLFSGRTDYGTLSKFWNLLWELFRQAFSGPTWLVLLVYGLSLLILALRRPLLAVVVFVPVAIEVVLSFAQLAPLGGGRTDAYLYAPIAFTIVFALDVVLRRLRGVDLPLRPIGERKVSMADAVGGVLALIVVALLVAAPAPAVTSLPPVIDTMPLIARMEAEAKPGDLIVVGGSQVFVYPLYSKRPFRTVRDTRAPGSFRPRLVGSNVATAETVNAAVRAPRRIADQLTETVWVIDSAADVQHPASSVRPALEKLGYRIESSRLATGAVLERWTRVRV